MVDKELLSRKLSQLREYLTALRNAEDITYPQQNAKFQDLTPKNDGGLVT